MNRERLYYYFRRCFFEAKENGYLGCLPERAILFAVFEAFDNCKIFLSGVGENIETEASPGIPGGVNYLIFRNLEKASDFDGACYNVITEDNEEIMLSGVILKNLRYRCSAIVKLLTLLNDDENCIKIDDCVKPWYYFYYVRICYWQDKIYHAIDSLLHFLKGLNKTEVVCNGL